SSARVKLNIGCLPFTCTPALSQTTSPTNHPATNNPVLGEITPSRAGGGPTGSSGLERRTGGRARRRKDQSNRGTRGGVRIEQMRHGSQRIAAPQCRQRAESRRRQSGKPAQPGRIGAKGADRQTVHF